MNKVQHFESGFDISGSEKWKAVIEEDLKGITFEELSSTDRNGILIRPFYTGTESFATFEKSADWFIMECIDVTNEKADNAHALLLLNNGATGLHFKVNAQTDLEMLLSGIDLKFIHLHLEAKDQMDLVHRTNIYLEKQYPGQAESLSIQLSDSQAFLFAHDSLQINAAIYNNAGANAVTEVAAIAAQVNEALHQAGHSQLEQLKTVYIQLAVDTWFYEQISKLRALRQILNQILSKYNVNARIFLAVTSSLIYLADKDIYNNILRNALSGMAAAIGGADSIYIHHFASSQEPHFTSRISRNQQLLFKEESYLNLVGDKSRGSYFIECYSTEMARLAWKAFQDIESQGGWLAVISNTQLKNQIAADARALVKTYQEGHKLLIGVNKYQMKNEENASIQYFPGQFGIQAINIQKSIS